MKRTVQDLISELINCRPDSIVYIEYPENSDNGYAGGTGSSECFTINQSKNYITITVI